MNINLMDFQEEYVVDFLEKLKKAKRHVSEDSELESILLSAPTGSGKTVMMSAIMERIFYGTENFAPEPDAVFLWLSDQPELNEQSRNRILKTSDLMREQHLIVLGTEFDKEQFDRGRVYFLNTQKLGKDKHLIKKGDSRTWTIWETIRNSINSLGDRFYLIVDEAHRGMNKTAAQEREASTIVQKFVIGCPELNAVPLAIGITATPDRFVRLVDNTDRHLYKVVVDVAKVRDSGLLKERMIVRIPKKEEQPNDWSLLKAAANQWKKMTLEWGRYCQEQKNEMVNPVMVIQVQDGTGERLTNTDMDLVVRTIEEAVGNLKDEEMAHSFEEDKQYSFGGHKIRHLDASRIDADADVKFVFFKMSLTTGWDCPRAEVMMSFRRAQDATLIAQLMGRMIRTPLARRIEGNELLNDVHLYLPYYDSKEAQTVVDKLKTDPDNVPATDVQMGSDFVELGLPKSKPLDNKGGNGTSETMNEPVSSETSSATKVSTTTTGTANTSLETSSLPSPAEPLRFNGLQSAGDSNSASSTTKQSDTQIGLQSNIPTQEFAKPESKTLSLEKSLWDFADDEVKSGAGTQSGDREEQTALPDKQNTVDVERVYKLLNSLPTYGFRQGKKVQDIKRLSKFAYELSVHQNIDTNALPEAKALVVDVLSQERDKLLASDKVFRDTLDGLSVVTVKPLIVNQHTFEVTEGTEETVEITEKNVDDLFRLAKLRLGDELCLEYLRRNHDDAEPLRAKLELYLLIQKPSIWTALDTAARGKIKALRSRSQGAISSLPSSQRQRFEELWASARVPEAGQLSIPRNISSPKAPQAKVYKKHLFCDEDGNFQTPLQGWEEIVLSKEIDTCIFWLRNVPRKQWALSYPYQLGGEWKPGFPDFLVISVRDGNLVVDILEPHSGSLADAPAKAQGMASFARDHGILFGRIEMERVATNGTITRLDFNDPEIRNRALKISTKDELDNLFSNLGRRDE